MEEKIKFETAKLAKEKGFDWEVTEGFTKDGRIFICSKSSGFFPKECRRPTQSLLQKWLREVHNIHVFATLFSYPNEYDSCIYIKDKEPIIKGINFTYEEALETGLQEALKLILNK